MDAGIPPLPPREFFRSDEEYLRARNQHVEMRKSRDDQIKTDEAMVILVSALCLGGAAVGLLVLSFSAFGWRGIATLLSTLGLLWVAFIQIRRRL